MRFMFVCMHAVQTEEKTHTHTQNNKYIYLDHPMLPKFKYFGHSLLKLGKWYLNCSLERFSRFRAVFATKPFGFSADTRLVPIQGRPRVLCVQCTPSSSQVPFNTWPQVSWLWRMLSFGKAGMVFTGEHQHP